jgi:hypothetical protein
MVLCRVLRRLSGPVALMAASIVALGLGPSSVAQAASSRARPGHDVRASGALVAASSRSGYECLPDAQLVSAKPGRVGSLDVHLDGYTVTYSASESHLSTGLFAYPGSLKVTDAASSWTVPSPSDPKDQYFQLGALCVVQFSPAAAPDVLAEGYWGGAHCCYGPTLYAHSAAGYRVVEDLTKPGVGKGLRWNPNGGFQPERISGRVVLESSDGAFPYAFGCYACTPAPTRLFAVSGGQLVDVTNDYPAVTRAEANAAWASALGSMRVAADAGLVEGPLAQWAADECQLGQGTQMWRALGQLQEQGKLAAAEQQSLDNKQPFPAQLKAFLLGHGYCTGQL